MANEYQQLMGLTPETQDIARQRELAKLLLQQGMANKTGQMVGNTYVPTHPLEFLGKLANVYVSKDIEKEADVKQQKLAEMLRNETVKGMQEYNKLRYGAPQQEVYGAGQEGPTKQVTEAVAPNPQAAFEYAMQSRSPMVNQMAMELLKPQKLSEGEVIQTYNPSTGKMETTAKGNEKYHPPIIVDTGTSTILLDPKTMQPIAKYGKATSGHIQETENGLVLVDPRTGQSRPITDQNGQLLQGGGKPLTESQSNAVAFGMRAKESNQILKGLEEKGITNTGLIKSTTQGTLGAVPLIGGSLSNLGGALTNWTASEGQQATDQARRNFITAVLRKESGASISPTEFENEEKKYFPQVGDSSATIKQKQNARDTAIQALEAQAGAGAKKIKEYSNLDQEALNWARNNPNDPRSSLILKKLGVK